jgi:ADP-heptose:LPS heptosyltransferase/glycosyltransferase involved in cell wall biosynthesis
MNILIIKIGAMGDVLRTSFIAQALKAKYRKSNPQVFWMTNKNLFPLFTNSPYVDELIDAKNLEQLRNKSFDLVVNLEENKEWCKFASSVTSKKLIGFYFNEGNIMPTETAREWFDMSALGKKPENDLLKKQNAKTHRQIISEIVGVNPEKYEPFLRLTQKQRKLANDFLIKNNLSKSDLIIGFNTGSADRWPKALSIKKTVELINKTHKDYRAKLVLFGGPQEIERNKEILKSISVPIIDAGCENDLVEFPALMSVCSLVISTDSFGLHVALALKRKVIALIGPTSPAEIDLYNLGNKIVAKSSDVCSYKTKTDCMNKIDVNEVLSSIKSLLTQKVSLVITAFNEPSSIKKALQSVLNQDFNKFDILVSAPDEATLNAARETAKGNRRVLFFRDPGKGKSYALGILFEKINADILILTDGDVFMGQNAITEILKKFDDREIGCVTGRPVPIEDKNTKYGYWANFLFESAHKWRKNAEDKKEFLECSGYLFAFRKTKLNKIPLDVAEDTVIPYLFWEKGYRISYAEKAKVYVKNVNNWSDWVKQKTRTSKAHETLSKYVDTSVTPRVKTFWNESKGLIGLFNYSKSLIQILWSSELLLARLFMWLKVFSDTKFRNKNYRDAWERIKSTKQ